MNASDWLTQYDERREAESGYLRTHGGHNVRQLTRHEMRGIVTVGDDYVLTPSRQHIASQAAAEARSVAFDAAMVRASLADAGMSVASFARMLGGCPRVMRNRLYRGLSNPQMLRRMCAALGLDYATVAK